MIVLAMLLQGYAPPARPAPLPRQPAIGWTCRLVDTHGAASTVRGQFGAIAAQQPAFASLAMTTVAVASDSASRLIGTHKAGLNYGAGRRYIFAVGPQQKMLHVAFEYDPAGKSAVMTVTQTGSAKPGAEPVASGPCDARPVAG